MKIEGHAVLSTTLYLTHFFFPFCHEDVTVKLENYADPSRVEIENLVNNSHLLVQMYHRACFLGKKIFISGSSLFYLKPYFNV